VPLSEARNVTSEPSGRAVNNPSFHLMPLKREPFCHPATTVKPPPESFSPPHANCFLCGDIHDQKLAWSPGGRRAYTVTCADRPAVPLQANFGSWMSPQRKQFAWAAKKIRRRFTVVAGWQMVRVSGASG